MLRSNWNHTPLYFLGIHAWAGRIGDSEFSLRFPSFVLGVFVVLAMFFATHRLAGNRAALFATFLLSVCTFHIHYSQDARPYALLALFSALAPLAFTRFLERPSILNSEGRIREILIEGRTTVFERRWDIVNAATGKTVSIDARLFERTSGSSGIEGDGP